MAARSSLNAKNLEALGAARLAALLLQLTEGNAAARRSLRLALAEGRGPEEMAQELRKRLASLERSNRWLEGRDRDAVFAELERQRQAIGGAIAEPAPALAFELLWRFLDLGTSLLDRCDDNDEEGLRLFLRVSADLGAVAQRANKRPEALADQVAEAWLGHHMGQYDRLITHLAPALGGEGLLRLRARMEAERLAAGEVDPETVWVEEDSPDSQGEDNDEEDGVCTQSDLVDLYPFHDSEYGDSEADSSVIQLGKGIWMSRFEPDCDDDGADGDADDLDPEERQQRVRLAMLAIADGLGDARAYWAEYRDHHPGGLWRPRIAARVARRLAAAGEPEPALAVLEAARLPRGPRTDGYRRWLDARLMVLEAMGRMVEAQQLRHAFALDRLSLPHLRDYLRRLPAFEDESACEQALDLVLRHANAPAALEFLQRWPDRRRLAQLILERPDQLHGGDEDLLTKVVGVLESSQPLAASVCLRLMVEFILETGQSNRYTRAVRYLERCRQLATSIENWAQIPAHNIYVIDLLRAYDHRMGFLTKLNDETLLVEAPSP
ncbi:MAG: hypothetical protein VKI42_00775 [Synechococcaceae cyanobacterium]|nr:hypothetical protein [Synechococcaceae cyanobacterium]